MKYIIKCIKSLLKAHPLLILVKIISLISGVVKSIIPVAATNIIVRVSTGELDYSIKKTMIIIASLFILLCVLSVVDIIMSYLNQTINRQFVASYSLKIIKKLDNIDYSFLENPEFLNKYARSLELGAYNIYDTANQSLDLIIYLFESLSLLSIIYLMHYSTIIFIILAGILYFILRLFMSKYNNKYRAFESKENRVINYSDRVFREQSAIMDIKMTEIGDIIIDDNDKSYNNILYYLKKYISKRTFIASIGEVLLTLLFPGIVIILTIVSLDNLDVENFSTLSVAATTLSTKISSIAQALGHIQDSSLEVKVPFDLMYQKAKIENKKEIKKEIDFNSLEIKNVDFSYDYSEDKSLNDISLTIKKGEKIAIVGENGAGKTTLVKLLLRLYDPSSGDIYINQENYKNINVSELRKCVGAVFQNVVVYPATIAENILLRKMVTKEDEEIVMEALKFSGLYDTVMKYNNTINEVISRAFNKDGIVLSGGEKQKLTIARGYAQNYNLFILDEPSSALDPLAEAKVYQRMIQMGKNKTLIFISHRLTTTVNADNIYIFKDGKIFASGNHLELMAKCPYYKDMFESQARKYLGGEENE